MRRMTKEAEGRRQIEERLTDSRMYAFFPISLLLFLSSAHVESFSNYDVD